jgi:hypothetical protein
VRDDATLRIAREMVFRDFAKRSGEKAAVKFIDGGVHFVLRGGDAAGGVATGVGGGLAIVRHVFNMAYLQPMDWVNALLP